MSQLKQRDGESSAAWLSRLRQIDPGLLSEHERFFRLQHALDAARVAVKRQEDDATYALASRGPESAAGAATEAAPQAPPRRRWAEETALEVCKTAYLALDREGREQFLLWANSKSQ